MAPRPLLAALCLVVSITASATTQPSPTYRVVSANGVQVLPVDTTDGVEWVTLDVIARLFGLTVRDDPRAGGAVVLAGTDRVTITNGQASASVGGRVVSLSAPVRRAGTTWRVPIDFVRAVVRGIEVRRSSRLLVVPPAVVPVVTPRLERTATGARLVLHLDPGVASRVTRDGGLVTIRLQAPAIDLAPLGESSQDVIEDLRVADTSVVLALGPSVTSVRADDTRDPTRVVVDLLAPAAVAPSSPAAPPLDLTATGPRTIAIDAGHGGDDPGARADDGRLEKDVTLAVALRVKALVESRFGLRVVMTRGGDETVSIDQRVAMANNAKADLLLSLHANRSVRPEPAGVQVVTLDAALYADLERSVAAGDTAALTVPVAGGGSRVIDAVPWHLAQVPQAARSADLATLIAQRLAAAGVPLHTRAVDLLPLRGLVAANMPAIHVELGFLSNPDDVARLHDPAHLSAIAEALVAALGDLRGGR